MLFGLIGPFAAAFMNRFGLRRVVSTALLLISAGFLGSLVMTDVWQLILLWGVVSASAPAWSPWCSGRRWRRAGFPSAAGWSLAC